MRDTDTDEVRAAHLFRDVDVAHFATLMRAAYLQRFPAHVALIDEGDKPDFLHVVLEGAVELYSRHDGRETTLNVVSPVTTFILAAVVGDLPYLAGARTLAPARVLMIPAETVRAVFDQDAAFARAIVQELSRSFRGVMRELKNQKLRTSIERLANWMLVADTENGGSGRFTLPFDKRTLASRLGMTPENLSRSMATLAAHGASVTGREVALTDRAALIRLAKPSPFIDAMPE
jgi:CRP/FNR family transcriptional activator FtrB